MKFMSCSAVNTRGIYYGTVRAYLKVSDGVLHTI